MLKADLYLYGENGTGFEVELLIKFQNAYVCVLWGRWLWVCVSVKLMWNFTFGILSDSDT